MAVQRGHVASPTPGHSSGQALTRDSIVFCCLRPNPAPLDGGVVHCQSSDPARANARGIRNRTSLAQHVRACNPGVSSDSVGRGAARSPGTAGFRSAWRHGAPRGASGAFPRCSVCSRRRLRWPGSVTPALLRRAPVRPRRSASGQDTPRGARRAGGIGRVEVPSVTETARSARRSGGPGSPANPEERIVPARRGRAGTMVGRSSDPVRTPRARAGRTRAGRPRRGAR